MHELGIARGIVDSAEAEAEKARAKKVVSVEVEVGELMQLDVPALEGALKSLMRGPTLEDAQIQVRLAGASFTCRRCGEEWGMGEARRQLAAVPDDLKVKEPDSLELPLHFLPYLYPAFVKCPACGSSDVSVSGGEDVKIARLVME